MNPIEKAVADAGGPVAFTRRINDLLERPISYQSVRKWVKRGRLPRTEWTGETAYATAIEAMLNGRVTREDLLRPPTVSTRAESGRAVKPCIGNPDSE